MEKIIEMNKKNLSQNISLRQKISIYVLMFASLIILCCAMFYGRNQYWYRFGLTLTTSIILTMGYMCTYLKYMIETKFNHLEKLILEKKESVKKRDIIRDYCSHME